MSEPYLVARPAPSIPISLLPTSEPRRRRTVRSATRVPAARIALVTSRAAKGCGEFARILYDVFIDGVFSDGHQSAR